MLVLTDSVSHPHIFNQCCSLLAVFMWIWESHSLLFTHYSLSCVPDTLLWWWWSLCFCISVIMWWFLLFLSETLGHKLVHWGASVMNLLLLTVPPLHSPVLEPDLHLKQQENGEEFLLNLWSQIFFLARLDCSSRQGNVCVSVHHFSPTTVGLT